MSVAENSATTVDLNLRYHTAFPTTGAAIATAGALLEAHAAVSAHFVAGMLTITAERKLWGYISTAAADGGSMLAHRLA